MVWNLTESKMELFPEAQLPQPLDPRASHLPAKYIAWQGWGGEG